MSDERAGSHLRALSWAIADTDGPILEIGVGQHSTPFLAVVAGDREFVSVETDPDWRRWASRFGHRVVAEIPSDVEQWSVVLVDGDAESREPALLQLRGVTEIFVCHDTELVVEPFYGWAETLATFEFRCDVDESPRTTLVSDLRPVEVPA